MKLTKWAKLKGISYTTAYRMAKKNEIPGLEIFPSGTIIVNENKQETQTTTTNEINVVYARVSSNSRKKELSYQVDRITEFANKKGFQIHKTYKEVASGMNDNRTQFWKMIETNPTNIFIENKDRLTRFGFNYIQKLGEKLNINIIVLNEKDTDENDLIKDLVSIITSFCCRLYGLRRGYNKAKKIQEQINNDNHQETT